MNQHLTAGPDADAFEASVDTGARVSASHNLFADPRFQFPVIGLALLALIWIGTWLLVDSEYSSARAAAATTTMKLASTYEAQVVRAVREVDLTLRFLQHVYEDELSHADASGPLLPTLAARNLLPPDLLFVVSITDARGWIAESTRYPGVDSVAGLQWFEDQRHRDDFLISPPHFILESNSWVVHFSRRLTAPNGDFAGIAIVTVDAAFFVSGYETSELGMQGVLGILGSDCIFRALRSGDMVTYGETLDYASLLAPLDASAADVNVNAWDGMARYTAVRELFGFPLAVVVGLAEHEQLAGVQQRTRTQILQAFGASIVMLLAVAVLGRLSWELQRSRMALLAHQMANAQRAEYFAYHDTLTGLANRSLFNKLLSHSFQQARRSQRSFSLLFLDLDRFKHINDTLGHDAGDALLREVAKRLNGAVRASDTVARLGGDEFVVLLPEQNDVEQLTTVATRILDSVRKPFVLGADELQITVSIGVSTYPQDGLDEQTLTKHADVAMYQAKKSGRNAFRFYSDTAE
ncbi:MAG: diguanylate cyclase [Pseudomonadota bacterium]|nr:diguanylate cyclase [Pseudomonadota bacterium]